MFDYVLRATYIKSMLSVFIAGSNVKALITAQDNAQVATRYFFCLTNSIP